MFKLDVCIQFSKRCHLWLMLGCIVFLIGCYIWRNCCLAQSFTPCIFQSQHLFFHTVSSLVSFVPFPLKCPEPYYRSPTLKTCDTSHSPNFFIKAQCAGPFHHLFIWANSIICRESMILRSREMHSALHPRKLLRAIANCIFMKECGQAILSKTRLLALQGLSWSCNWLTDTDAATSSFSPAGDVEWK